MHKIVFCLCLGVFVFVFVCFLSLRLGQCYHQMISFQKIIVLYGLEHHTVEINGDFTLGHGHTDM